MKRLYLIGGTMGVCKTTVCEHLKRLLNNSVFLDGDWCWDSHPFQVTEETKNMVTDNICYLLNNFLHCSAYDNIIFCWVMHRQDIVDKLLKNLDTSQCDVKVISLTCDEKTLRERLQKDIEKGVRTADVIDRSIERLPLYRDLKSIKIDTTSKSIEAIAKEIIAS
ncbi:MAG: AAA family ATPase [Clostridiales bacterium]|nr:AAA family ATPase [Clostridiales bacterium]